MLTREAHAPVHERRPRNGVSEASGASDVPW